MVHCVVSLQMITLGVYASTQRLARPLRALHIIIQV
jgi:DMSO reductase anchor subunit